MTPFRPRRRLAALLLVLLTSSAIPQVHGFEKVAKGVAFTMRCFGLMLSDPDTHVEVCNPVHRPPAAVLQSESESAPPPAVVPPPPPPDDDGCSEGQEPDNCGGCYYPK